MRIRMFEEECSKLYKARKIQGFCHLSIGQEAVYAGIAATRRSDDDVTTAYRCHGLALAVGMTMREVIAELMGKEGGSAAGRGGSMHIFDASKHFWGGHGIVGIQVPIGTGIAFARKMQGSGGVCIAMMGDGAANQGQVAEAMNMAAIWKLPVLFFIENNMYGMGIQAKNYCGLGCLKNT